MALDFPNSPTNGQLYTSNNVTWEYDSSTSTWDVKYDGVAGTTRVALLKDQKNFGVNGGIFTNDAWRDRDLTVKEDPQNFVTFFPTANGQTTPSPADAPGYWSLPAGTYKIDWSAPAFEVNRHKSRLVWSTTQLEISTAGLHANIVAAGDIAEGSNADTTNHTTGGGSDDEHVTTQSSGFKIITITETTYFKILHWAVVTRGDVSNPDGFGEGMSPGGSYDTGSEIYTQVRIEDLYTTVKNNATYVEGTSRIASVKDVKGNTDPGGQITANTWTTRDLNTIADPSSIGISVSSDSSGTGNYITVPAGTYKITWKAPGWRLYTFQTKLEYSIDSTFATGVTKVIGSSEYASSTDGANTSQTSSEGLLASVTFTQETYVRIRQWAGVTGPTTPTNGLGVASYNDVLSTYSGESSIYTTVQIEDLATAVKDNATYVEGTSRVAILEDQKTQNTSGGTSLTADWNIRVLNTKTDLSDFVSFGGGTTGVGGNNTTFSLAAGTYSFQWRAPAWDTTTMRTRLAYSADSGFSSGVTYIYGESAEASSSPSPTFFAAGKGVVTITETTHFRIEHYTNNGAATNGLGNPNNITGVNEVYTQVIIEDLATAVKDNATYVEGTTRIARLYDEKTQNTNAGAPSGTGFEDRTLNQTDDPYSIVTLDSGNVYFSLAAGSYKISWRAPGQDCNRFRTKLVYANNTSFTSSSEVLGESAKTDKAVGVEGQFYGCGTAILTTTETKYFKIQQSLESLGNWGVASNIGGPEIYTQVFVEDLATAVKTSTGDGKVINVWNVVFDGTQYIRYSPYPGGSATWQDISDLTMTLTPTSASSKFLITATVNAGMGVSAENDCLLRLVRDTTVIGSTNSILNGALPDTTGFAHLAGQQAYTGIQSLNISYLDTPNTTSPITYHIQGINIGADQWLLINYRGAGTYLTTSQMTITELRP